MCACVCKCVHACVCVHTCVRACVYVLAHVCLPVRYLRMPSNCNSVKHHMLRDSYMYTMLY